jgi:hypothetical protein
MAPAGTFARLFAELAGEWRLQKTFSDGSRFSGHAIFDPIRRNAHAMNEKGVLTLPDGNSLAASRQWDWFLDEDGSLAIAYPADQGGSLYHRLIPKGSDGAFSGGASHLCAADNYDAEYRFDRASIVIDHRVKGPKKDYRIEALFTR